MLTLGVLFFRGRSFMYSSSNYRTFGRKALSGHWGVTMLVTFVAGILGGTITAMGGEGTSVAGNNSTTEYVSNIPPEQIPVQVKSLLVTLGMALFILLIVNLVFGGAVSLGLCKYNINLFTKEEKPTINILFSRFSVFGKAFLLQNAIAIMVLLWTCLFIIPGIIAAYKYSMAFYFMAQNPTIGVFEAIDLSKKAMQGNKMRLFWLQLSFIGWALLAVLTMGLGMVAVIPYENAAITAFYLDITGQLPAAEAAT